MTTLILLFHPDYAHSKANRALARAAATLPSVSLVEMSHLYPDAREIDLDAEVERLLAADRLILQFPVQWYSTPSLLKAWQDSVLTRMYYIRAADEGERLRGLPVMVAVTAGNEPAAYMATGINLFPLPELLKPLHSTANRCYWRWCDPFIVYRANKLEPDKLEEEGRRYAECIRTWQDSVPSLSKRG